MPTITRRIVRRSDQVLQVTNPRDSVGVDSLSSSAPPPCYTSQREVASSVATSDGTQSINPSEDNDSEEQGSVSMHSCHDILPSPYSTEDLFAGIHHVQDHTEPAAPSSTHTQSCIHGYTHTHSQCTIEMPPTTYDSHLPAPPRSISQSTNPYHYIYQGRNTRYSSTPTTPYASLRGLPRPSEPASPRSILYHHRPSSQPAAIGHLTHRPLKSSYELHLEPDDQINTDGEHTTQVHTTIANSSITFLPEGGYSSRSVAPRREHSSLATSHVPDPDPIVPPPTPTKTRATNFVSLSRKSTVKKGGFFRASSAPSSITGKFTIDPSLYIPSALLKAMESWPLSSADTSHFPPKNNLYQPSSKVRPRGKIRRKNLLLEVENGGIDVDVHLVPYIYQSVRSNRDVGDDIQPHFRPSFSRRPSSRRSEGQGYDSPMEKGSPTHISSPTLIDLRLKQSSPKSSRRGKDFTLVARIHAPTPRPPFHILASTIDVPVSENSTLSDLSSKTGGNKNHQSWPLPNTSPSHPSSASSPSPSPAAAALHKEHTSKPALERNRGSTITGLRESLSRSELTLHLPRNFRGPLTVHVAAGNIDEHVRLSKEVAGTVVVLSESAFSRGYYIGMLSPSESEELENMAYEEGEVDDPIPSRRVVVSRDGLNGVERDVRRRQDGEGEDDEDIYKIDRAKGLSAMSGFLDDTDSDKNDEWHGDKVDVVVGDGKFYLQFLDEQDPFGKKGRFWKNLIPGYR